MSSNRVHRKIEILCDGVGCHEFFEEDTNSWQEAWNSAQADGWTSKKVDTEWFNYCPSCSKTFSGKFDPRKLL